MFCQNSFISLNAIFSYFFVANFTIFSLIYSENIVQFLIFVSVIMTSCYKYPDYGSELLRGLNELRRERTGCDAVLQTNDGKKFWIHRAVLMAVSPYFRGMFSSGFKEATEGTENPICLPTVSSVGLGPVLDVLYSGELELTKESVYDVLSTAHMLQMDNILDSCTQFLIGYKNMSTTTCFPNLRLSEKYDLKKLQQASENFLLRHFFELSSAPEFLKMDSAELFKYLKHSKLRGMEIDIFRAVKEWLEYEPDRKTRLVEVMSSINFKAIPAEDLTDEVMKYDSLRCDENCVQMVIEALEYHSDLYSQPYNPPLTLRGEDIVVTVGPGWLGDPEVDDDMEETTDLQGFRISQLYSDRRSVYIDEYSPLECLFCVLLFESCNIVKVNNFLFLFATDRETSVTIAKRYDGTINTVIDLSPVPRSKTVYTSAVHLGGAIYLCGGMYLDDDLESDPLVGSKFTDSNYCYSVKHNEWREVKTSPLRMACHSACAYRGFVYVAGGYVPRSTDPDAFQVSKKLFAYDSKADIWLSKADMNMARSLAVFDALNDKLFVAGGGSENATSVRASPTIEMYDIRENQWTTVVESSSENLPYRPCYILDGEKIYIFGGVDLERDLHPDTITDTITVFDTKSRTINTTGPKLFTDSGIATTDCAVIKVNV